MISAISVKDRLKNQAKEDGRTMQDELVTYGRHLRIEKQDLMI